MKDPALRSVSIAARGLWIDMLCLLFESDRRGYLQHCTGKPVTPDQLARMTGCSAEEVSRLLQELEDSGVFSRTDHGVLFSRRMVSDERKRMACSEAGRKGGGNPILQRTFKGNGKGDAKGMSKHFPKASSSTSSSSSDKDPPKSSRLREDFRRLSRLEKKRIAEGLCPACGNDERYCECKG